MVTINVSELERELIECKKITRDLLEVMWASVCLIPEIAENKQVQDVVDRANRFFHQDKLQ